MAESNRMNGRRAIRLIILLASLAILVACGGGGEDPGKSGGDASTGAVYLESPWSLTRIDLAERQALEAYRFQQLSRERAVAFGDGRLAYGDVVRSGGAWLPMLHVLERDTGAEQAVIALAPVPDSAGGDPGFFSGTMRVWYLPEPDLVAVAMAVSQLDTTTYRLDLVDGGDLSLLRTIELGETPEPFGGISMALDSSGNVAVLLGDGRMSRLLVSSDRLLSFQPAGVVTACLPGFGSSTASALRRYFLCFEPGQKSSLLVFDESGAVERHRLPGEFLDPLFGVADAGSSVFVGNVHEVTVIEFDLVSQQVVAERQITQREGSSFLEPFKRFLFGRPALAIEVVRRPIAVSPDEQHVYFTDRRTIYCLSAGDLELIGQTEFDSVRALAAWNEDTFFAAGETTLHVMDAATCQERDSIRIPFDTGGATSRIFVP